MLIIFIILTNIMINNLKYIKIMCDFTNIPTEIILYNEEKLNIYLDSELVNTIDIDIDIGNINMALLFPLPDKRFLFIYANFIEYWTAIGNYKSNKLVFNNDIHVTDFPPVIDGTFVSPYYYYEIKPDNKINIIPLNDNSRKYMSANIKKDVNDTKTNIDSLLVKDINNIAGYRQYNSNKVFDLNINSTILAWFDNRYILAYGTMMTTQNLRDIKYDVILYDINELYDEKVNILNLKPTEYNNIVAVIASFKINDLGLSDIKRSYTRTASDGAIDVFLNDSKNNIAVIHIDSNRDFSIENYKYTKNTIGQMIGDEFGIAIWDRNTSHWYYIDRYTRCINEIALGIALTFTNEIHKQKIRQKIKEENISGLVSNVQGIVGEYFI